MTNNFPGVGYVIYGHSFNYYNSLSITATGFGSNSVSGQQPDAVITFSTYGVIFTNETSGQVVEYSFNGQSVHGVLDGTSTSTTRVVTFLNRVASPIWFRLKSGSAGPATVTITAWGIR